MIRYLLDTNTVSHIVYQHPLVLKRLIAVPITSVSISSITEGEIRFGLAKAPNMKKLQAIVHEFLLRVDVVAWDSVTAQVYGTVRAALEKEGRILSPLDLMIGVHAIAFNAVLVTSDKAFSMISGLTIEDWTKERSE